MTAGRQNAAGFVQHGLRIWHLFNDLRQNHQIKACRVIWQYAATHEHIRHPLKRIAFLDKPFTDETDIMLRQLRHRQRCRGGKSFQQ